jgi:uncharacterized membrane protein
MGFWILVLLIWVIALSLRVRRLQQTLDKQQSMLERLHKPQRDQDQEFLHHPKPDLTQETPQQAPPADAWTSGTGVQWSAKTNDSKRPEPATANTTSRKSPGWEHQLTVRLSVWLGGIALAFAGVFLVRYSIETDLLSPAVRVGAGLLSGLALLFVAEWLRRKPDFANGVRISQALSGAAIVVLYAAIFAAASLYQMIPAWAGFAGMAAVTAAAVFLSLKYGPPIALLGLLGGFATPALISSESPGAAGLFIYLLLMFCGLLLVLQRQRWWLLILLTIVVAFLWVPLWLWLFWTPGDGIWLGLFLAGAAIMLAWSTARNAEPPQMHNGIGQLVSPVTISYAGFGSALVLMAVVLIRAQFGAAEWALIGLLCAGTLLLAWGKPLVYQMAPFASLGISLVLLLLWRGQTELFATILGAFTILFAGTSLFLLYMTRQTLLWSLMLSLSAYNFFVLAWFRQSRLFAQGLPDFVWAMSALLLALAAICLVFMLQRRVESDKALAQRVQSVFILAATAFFSSGAAILLDMPWWTLVLCAELLVIAWLHTRTSIDALPRLMKILLTLLLLSLIPLALITEMIVIHSLQGLSADNVTGSQASATAAVQFPLLRMVLGGLLVAGAGFFLRQSVGQQTRFVALLDWVGLTLVALGLFYWLRQILMGSDAALLQTTGFGERGWITAAFMILAGLILYLGQRAGWHSFRIAGLVLAGLALVRVVYFDLLILNPWWSGQSVYGLPILNMLWLNYMLPLVALAWLQRKVVVPQQLSKPPLLFLLMLILGLAFITLQVRHFYQGEILVSSLTSNAEIYTYSVAWLLSGLLILALGVIRHNPMLRYASLGVVVLAVGKVFLYDTSQLEGLYRVASFVGLGFSLIAVSYFYSRFVFARINTANI